MKPDNLPHLTADDLVTRFAKICVAQDEALLGGESQKFRRLFDAMMEVANELKSRSGDQRRLLVRLFDYPNMQVRVQAAKLARPAAPVEARRQLEAIASSQWFPQAGDAGMSLALWDKGIAKLD